MKPYLLLGAILMYLGSLWGAVKYGEQRGQTRSVKAVLEFKQNEDVQILKNAQTTAIKIAEVIERVKIIKAAPDPSGCTKSRAPDSWADGLQIHPSAKLTQPAVN